MIRVQKLTDKGIKLPSLWKIFFNFLLFFAFALACNVTVYHTVVFLLVSCLISMHFSTIYCKLKIHMYLHICKRQQSLHAHICQKSLVTLIYTRCLICKTSSIPINSAIFSITAMCFQLMDTHFRFLHLAACT